MRTLPDAIRIYQNIDALLANGLFPGNCAVAVAEARELIQSVIKDATNEQEAAQPSDSSDQPGADASGVAGS